MVTVDTRIAVVGCGYWGKNLVRNFFEFGDKKMAVFDDVAERDKLLLYNHKIEWIDRIPVPRREDAETINFVLSEPLKEECKHFIQCIKTRERPKTDGYSGRKVLTVLEACQQSLAINGETVKLDAWFKIENSKSKTSNIYPSHRYS